VLGVSAWLAGKRVITVPPQIHRPFDGAQDALRSEHVYASDLGVAPLAADSD